MDIITSLTWTIYHFIVGQIIILNSLLKSSFPLTMQVVNRGCCSSGEDYHRSDSNLFYPFTKVIFIT